MVARDSPSRIQRWLYVSGHARRRGYRALSRDGVVIRGLGISAVEWWRRSCWSRPRITKIVRCTTHADLPEQLSPRRLYSVGMSPTWAVFRCPCGRGHDLTIDIANRWRLSGPIRPSLTPSVWEQGGWGCHFWLRFGNVRWCPGSPPIQPGLPSRRRYWFLPLTGQDGGPTAPHTW